MSIRRPVFFAVLLAAGVASTGLVACASSEEPAPTVEEVHRHRHGAVNAVLETTLDRAALSPEQLEAVEAIRTRMEADRETRRALRERMRRSASDMVRNGTTDSEAFAATVEEAADAMEERIELSADAVKELHGMLSTDQRAAVAEGLRERIDRRFGERRRRGHEAMRGIAEELMLSKEQVEGLKAIRDDMLGQAKRLRPTPEELYELADAFETDSFGAALDAFHADKAPLLREKLADASGHADAALSLLDDSQRDVLADVIEHGHDAVQKRAER